MPTNERLMKSLKTALIIAFFPYPTFTRAQSAEHRKSNRTGEIMLSTNTQSEAALRDIVAQQGRAWNRGDAAAWSSFFTEDARFVTLRGDVFQNRAAIEKSHTMIFSTFYKGSQNTPIVESITFPTPDVAVVDVLHEVRDYATLPPGIGPTEPGVLRARMKYVAVRQGSQWRFSSAQNTVVFPKPMTPPQK